MISGLINPTLVINTDVLMSYFDILNALLLKSFRLDLAIKHFFWTFKELILHVYAHFLFSRNLSFSQFHLFLLSNKFYIYGYISPFISSTFHQRIKKCLIIYFISSTSFDEFIQSEHSMVSCVLSIWFQYYLICIVYYKS